MHKNLLAASSQYFNAALDRLCKEVVSGEWMTSHPSHVIKVVLTLLYTEKINSKLIQEDPLAIVSVASEYSSASLKSLAKASCVCLVNGSSIHCFLQPIHLYAEVCFRQVWEEESTGCDAERRNHKSQDR